MPEKTIGQALLEGKEKLREARIDSWALDAALLLMHVTGLEKTALFTRDREVISEDLYRQYLDFIKERQLLKPIAYIIHQVEFMSLEFYVDEQVLIPRPDTECVVETAIFYIKERGYRRVLDLCTGSGCIAVSIAKNCKDQCFVTASDISPEALLIARKNAIKNHLENEIEFVFSNLFSRLRKKKVFDILISNPPYITADELNHLDKNVIDYEPVQALSGGVDGLTYYRGIAENAHDYLRDEGMIVLEIGADQKKAVTDIFIQEGYKLLFSRTDLSGQDRVLVFSR